MQVLRMRPATNYVDDLLGRLIGVIDANGNINKSMWSPISRWLSRARKKYSRINAIKNTAVSHLIFLQNDVVPFASCVVA